MISSAASSEKSLTQKNRALRKVSGRSGLDSVPLSIMEHFKKDKEEVFLSFAWVGGANGGRCLAFHAVSLHLRASKL